MSKGSLSPTPQGAPLSRTSGVPPPAPLLPAVQSRLLPAPAICPLTGQVHVLPPDGASVQSRGRAPRPLRTEQAAPATSPEVTPGAERPPRGRRQVLSARPVPLGHVPGARGPVAGPRGVHTHRDTWQGTLGCSARGAGAQVLTRDGPQRASTRWTRTHTGPASLGSTQQTLPTPRVRAPGVPGVPRFTERTWHREDHMGRAQGGHRPRATSSPGPPARPSPSTDRPAPACVFTPRCPGLCRPQRPLGARPRLVRSCPTLCRLSALSDPWSEAGST